MPCTECQLINQIYIAAKILNESETVAQND